MEQKTLKPCKDSFQATHSNQRSLKHKLFIQQSYKNAMVK